MLQNETLIEITKIIRNDNDLNMWVVVKEYNRNNLTVNINNVKW